MRVKTANLTKPKFPSDPFFELKQRKIHKIRKYIKGINVYLKIPSAPFFELTERKVRKIKKFQRGHKCIPKQFLEAQ